MRIDTYLATYALACTLLTLIAVFIIGWHRATRFRYFAPLFLSVMYMSYVARPFLALVVDSHLGALEAAFWSINSLAILPTLDRFAIAYGLAILFFAVGYRLLPRGETRSPDSLRILAVWQRRSISRLALALVVVGYGSFFISRRGFLGLAGGGGEAFVVTAGGTGYANTTGYIELANYLVVSGSLLYYAATGRILPVLLMSFPWTVNQAVYAYNRYMILTLYVGLFAIWLVRFEMRAKRSRRQLFVVPFLALVVVIYIVSIRGQRSFLRQGVAFREVVSKSARQPLGDVLGDLAGFEGAWYMMDTIDRRVPKYGAGVFYQYVVRPIPRLLWRAKPFPLEFTWNRVFGLPEDPATELLRYDDSIWWTGPVKGSIGLAMEEWGWFGIPLTFSVTGLFLAWVERRLVQSGYNSIWIAAYGATYCLVTVLGRVDLFLAGPNQLLLFYVPYLLVYWWVEKAPHARRRIRQTHLRQLRASRSV